MPWRDLSTEAVGGNSGVHQDAVVVDAVYIHFGGQSALPLLDTWVPTLFYHTTFSRMLPSWSASTEAAHENEIQDSLCRLSR